MFLNPATLLFLLFSFCSVQANGQRKHRFGHLHDNFPIISHLRPDTQNSHLAWVYWTFNRSPKTYERFELYDCYYNETYQETNTVPNAEILARVPTTHFEAIIKNMPETKRPCVIVCAILKENLASCSKKFACFNTKYTIPTGSMRSMTPRVAPIMVKAGREFDHLQISWRFPFSNAKISSFLIDINYGSDMSYQSIDEMLRITEIVQSTDTRVDIRLDPSQIDTEKFVFIKVCSVMRMRHREHKNCSDQIVVPLSEVEEYLQEDMAVEITGTRAHIHSANVMLGEAMENRNTSELSVMCVADHETDRVQGMSPRVLEWRTSNMRGNILNLEGLNPGTGYRCSIQAKPLADSLVFTIYAKRDFTFRTKSIHIERPPTPVLSGSQYSLEGNQILHPFSVQLEPTTPQVEIRYYILVAWPESVKIPEKINKASLASVSETGEKTVPFIQEILKPDTLPLEYMFDFVVNKKAYKQGECYYFILAVVPFEANDTQPFSTSNRCIKFSYTEAKATGMSERMKKLGLVSIALVTAAMLVCVLMVMVCVVWKLRVWMEQSNNESGLENGGELDKVLSLWDKVRGKGQYRKEDVKEVSLNEPKVRKVFLADSDTCASTPEKAPLISQANNDYYSD